MPLFNKKFPPLSDFSVLMVDFHNHVLPGMDDGSPSIEESLKMLNAWVDLGYSKVITTPHVIASMYPNTKEQILGQMYHLREVIEENNIPLELEASAEYQIDFEFLDKLESGEVIPFGQQNYLLLELPWQKPAYSIADILFKVSLAGYEPILTHPERYVYLSADFKKYEKLKDRGLLFQLNMNSLTGLYGRAVQKVAEKLIKNGMVEFVGSDAHHHTHLKELKKLYRNQLFADLVYSGKLKNKSLL